MKYEPPYGAPGADDSYVNGDPSIARQGSIIPAAAVENPQREIVNFITKSGLTPTDDDLMQLTRGVRRQWVNFCVDSGAANALSVALDPPLEAYRQGLPLRVLVANDNTGNCTINVNSLGNRPIVRTNGAQLQPGDLRAGMIASLTDDGTRFQLTNYLGASGGTINNYFIHIPYAEDTSVTPNTITVSFSPAITTVNNGDLIEVRVANANTGNTQIAINALAAQPIRRNDGQPLQGQDLNVNEAILLEWNHSYWQVLRLVRSQVYFKLSADLTIYVDAVGGNDLNDGHDAAHAFKTIPAAVTYVKYSFLIAGRKVTFQLAPGTYVPLAPLQVVDMPGTVVINGDPANKLSYVIQPMSGYDVIGMSGSGTTVYLQGVTLQTINSSYSHMEVNYGATCYISDIAFTGPGAATCIGTTAGTVTVSNTMDVYCSCGTVFSLSGGATLTIGLWYTLINIHGSVFGTAFIECVYSFAEIAYGYAQFAGGGSGPRYIAIYNSVIYTGGGPNYLPGSQPGSVDPSSVYA